MRYEIVADAYRDLEAASARLALIDRLAELFTETPVRLLPTVSLLCQGQIAPDFAGVEIGLADKLAARAVAEVAGTTTEAVRGLARDTGDLGLAAEQLLSGRAEASAATAEPAASADTAGVADTAAIADTAETSGSSDAAGGAKSEESAESADGPEATEVPGLQVGVMFDTLHEIAAAAGEGSQGRKLALLVGLLEQATPLEARYLLRTVTANLRLGIGTATILDALAQVHAGGRKSRPVLERAYNICSDLGLVASTLTAGGLAAVEQLQVRAGNPVRPMLAQRMSTTADVLDRLGGECAAEYKYDGIRVQVHRTGDGHLELFTRRLERIAPQFPDVMEVLAAGLKPREAIMEGELVAFDPASGDLRPFQDLMYRRRKYGITEAMAEVPVSVFCFDLLYVDGEDLTHLPYRERRARLEQAVAVSPQLRLAASEEVSDVQRLEVVFEQAVADGCEGLICKSLAADAGYQAGARAWRWIKLKRDYRTELADTLDLVVVGALAGKGRRAGVYGALLLAVYDPDTDQFATVCKCGTGFSDAELATLPERLAPLARAERPDRVNAHRHADVWFEPSVVVEVLAAELSLSPTHTAGWGQLQADTGLALRFPRFTGRYRPDKAPEDATTVAEVVQMFRTARREPTGA